MESTTKFEEWLEGGPIKPKITIDPDTYNYWTWLTEPVEALDQPFNSITETKVRFAIDTTVER